MNIQTSVATEELTEEEQREAQQGFLKLHVQNPEQQAAVIQELQRVSQSARDYVAPAQSLMMAQWSELSDTDNGPERVWKHGLSFPVGGENLGGPRLRFDLRQHAHMQLAAMIGIPGQYYRRLQGENDPGPDLLQTNVNHWLHKEDEQRKFMLRTLDGKIRSMHSNGYWCLDSYDLAFHTLKVTNEMGALVQRMDLDDDHFYARIIHPEWYVRLEKHADGVRRIATEEKGGMFTLITDREGHANHDAGQATVVQHEDLKLRGSAKERAYLALASNPELMIPVVNVTNSETGDGKLRLDVGLLTPFCDNAAFFDMGLGQIHHGKRQLDGLLSTETKKLQATAFWAEIEDVLRGTFNPTVFHDYVVKTLELQETLLEDPIGSVEQLVKMKDATFTDDEKQQLINAMMTGQYSTARGATAYSLVNAVTQIAHADGVPMQRQVELERFGGSLVQAFPRELVVVRR